MISPPFVSNAINNIIVLIVVMVHDLYVVSRNTDRQTDVNTQ